MFWLKLVPDTAIPQGLLFVVESELSVPGPAVRSWACLACWLESVSGLMCLYFHIATHRWQKTAWQEEFMRPDGWWELAFCLSQIHACSLEGFIFSVHWQCGTFLKFCCCRMIRERVHHTFADLCYFMINKCSVYKVGGLPSLKYS